MIKGTTDQVQSSSYNNVAPAETKPASGYGKVHGKVPAPRAPTTGGYGKASAKSIAQESLKPGTPPPPRSVGSPPAPPRLTAPSFGDLARFLSAKGSAPTDGGQARWLADFADEVHAFLKQPAAFADEGLSIRDQKAIVDRLIQRAVGAAPASDKARLAELLQSPEIRANLESTFKTLQGDIESRLVAQPKEGFERTLDPNTLTLENLPASLRESSAFKGFLKDFKRALAKGGSGGANEVQKLAPKLNEILKSSHMVQGEKVTHLDASQMFALSFSNGKALFNSLAVHVRDGASNATQRAINSTLHTLGKDGAAAFHYRAVSELGGHFDAEGNMHIGKEVYTKGRSLGSGNFSDVVEFKLDSEIGLEKSIAVKIQTDPDHAIGTADGRSHALATGTGTANRFITPLTGGFVAADKVVTFMPLAKLGSLESAMETLDDERLNLAPETVGLMKLTLALDAFEGVKRLHQATGQDHFDLAPRNIFVDAEGVGMVGDFGLAENLVQKEGQTKEEATVPRITEPKIQPIPSTAPERLKGGPADAKADVWSMGLVLHELVIGPNPFKQLPATERRGAIDAFNPQDDLGRPDPKKWPNGMAEKLHALIASMLDHDPAKRPTIEQVIRQLEADFPGVGRYRIREKIIDTLGIQLPKQIQASNPAPVAVAATSSYETDEEEGPDYVMTPVTKNG